MSKSEYELLKCQNGILKRGGDRRALPYVFTEQGVAMLSGILRSAVAIQVNISIMRAFVLMRSSTLPEFDISSRLILLEQFKSDAAKKINYILNEMAQKILITHQRKYLRQDVFGMPGIIFQNRLEVLLIE